MHLCSRIQCFHWRIYFTSFAIQNPSRLSIQSHSWNKKFKARAEIFKIVFCFLITLIWNCGTETYMSIKWFWKMRGYQGPDYLNIKCCIRVYDSCNVCDAVSVFLMHFWYQIMNYWINNLNYWFQKIFLDISWYKRKKIILDIQYRFLDIRKLFG